MKTIDELMVKAPEYRVQDRQHLSALKSITEDKNNENKRLVSKFGPAATELDQMSV
jgi:hypothetical protein